MRTIKMEFYEWLKTKTFAAVLSGGGFNGAIQNGAIEHLAKEGIYPKYIWGISVGALNGAMWAQGPDGVLELHNMWKNIKFSDMFKGPKLWNLLRYHSIWNNSPIIDKIIKHVHINRMKDCVFAAGVVNMSTRKYNTISNITHTEYELRKGILYSTSVPFEMRLYREMGSDHLYADGGLWNVTPFGDLIDISANQIDYIIVINCYNEARFENPSEVQFRNIPILGLLDRIKVSIDVLVKRSILSDLKTFKTVNNIVLNSGNDKLMSKNGYYRYIPYTIIKPDNNYDGMYIDEQKNRGLRNIGFVNAQKFTLKLRNIWKEEHAN